MGFIQEWNIEFVKRWMAPINSHKARPFKHTGDILDHNFA